MNNKDDGYTIINGRKYPSNYGPGKNWALDEAWSILDSIKDGIIPDDVRSFLAGSITATILRHANKVE